MAKRIRLNDEPRTINRNAIIVQPRQRFLDWLQEVDPDASNLSLKDLCLEPSIWLVPELESQEGVEPLLRRCFDTIFTEHLDGWYRDPSVWPAPRTFAMFQVWFEWTYHSMVIDLVNGELARDDE